MHFIAPADQATLAAIQRAETLAQDVNDKAQLPVDAIIEMQRLLEQKDNGIEARDALFLRHFLGRIDNPAARTHPLIANIALHFSNVLGMQEYRLLAGIFKLPKRTYVKGLRANGRQNIYLSSCMHERLDIRALTQGNHVYSLASDETRVISKVSSLVFYLSSWFLVSEWLRESVCVCLCVLAHACLRPCLRLCMRPCVRVRAFLVSFHID